MQSESGDDPENRILCYFFDKLGDAKPDATIYSWEKFKLG